MTPTKIVQWRQLGGENCLVGRLRSYSYSACGTLNWELNFESLAGEKIVIQNYVPGPTAHQEIKRLLNRVLLLPTDLKLDFWQ